MMSLLSTLIKKELEHGMISFTLPDGKLFPSSEDPSSVLFVRPAMQAICDAIVANRTVQSDGCSVICKQPGIGKSYILFYLVYLLLQLADVDVVVLEDCRAQIMYFFYAPKFDQKSIPIPLQGLELISFAATNSIQQFA